MDLTSKNMYDTFKDEIWKELGPLDPDWFDALTSLMFTNDGNVSDQDDLCANQEGNFKTPFGKTAVDSQLSSTPRVFRHSRAVSPEPEDDQSFINEQEKTTLPWTATQSPYLFWMSKEGVPGAKYGGMQPQSQDSFDLLHTPHKSPVNYAKQISESLGAQIHPDISWTSSLNTPPAVPSTLILSKTDESPCPVSVSADKNVVFVRKLFPSLSNASRIGALSPKNTDTPGLHQGVVSPEGNQNPEPHDSPQSSLNQSEGVWRQKLPDAIEDGEIRSTVASVLDGAENVLSIFFTNSSSALRKVKIERNRRKQIIPTKEYGCSAEDISETNNTASSEQRTDDQEPSKCSSSPAGNTAVTGTSQWSPLSLSEIPPCTMDTSCPDNSPATQLENKMPTQSDTDSGQVVKPPLTGTQSGLTKRKRKFIYTVPTQEKQRQSQKGNSSQRIPDFGSEVSVEEKLGKTRNEADNCSIGKDEMRKKENVAEENLPPSVQAKVHDFDMSQLCRDFAEDFSQISDLSKLSKVAEDPPQNNFSPSTCLSAMKQAKQKASQANLHLNSDGISKRRHVSATNPNFSINGDTISDSGFQSTVGGTTHLTTTSFVLPSSENNSQCQSAFKACTHRSAPFLSANKGNTHLDDILQETDANLCSAIKESQTVDPGTESELHKDSMSTQLPSSAKGDVDNINCILQNDQVNGPEKTIVSLPSIHASGFKTASNKGIQISSANLERAKCLFQENEAEKTYSDQPTKSAHNTKDEISLSHGSVKNTTSGSNQLQSLSEKCESVTSQLTASQKADVTDLCTLLEEADSQLEFTQFRTAQLKRHSPDKPQRDVKELDPDFFTGIDFDDSFSSDAEKHMEITVMPDKSTSTNCETSKEFKTTGDSILRVSKKCLSNTRALFADMEENQKSPYKQSSEIDAKTEEGQITVITTNSFKNSKMDITKCQIGFQMASGNKISVSAKDMQEVDAFFKDGNILDRNIGMSIKHKSSINTLPGSVKHKKNLPEFKNPKEVKGDLSEDPIGEFESINSGPAAYKSNLVQPDVKIHSLDFKNTSALTNAVPFHENQSLIAKAQDNSSSAINELNNDFGFSAAYGKKIFVSVDSAKKAEGLLNEIHILGEADKQLKEKGDALRTGCLTNQIQVAPSKNGGFQTASGKGVAISSAALKKAKSLLSEFDAVEDNICVKPAHTGPPHNNHGFLAASGKPVALSAKALQKAKALFSDISFIMDIPPVSDTSCSSKTQDNARQTGKTIQMFQKSQLKARNISNEFEDSGHGCGEFENMHVRPVLNHEIVQHLDVELNNGVLKNTLNSTNPAPLRGNSALKPLCSPFCSTSKKSVSSAFNEFSSSGGFCAASGKRVSVSDDALTEANFVLSKSFAFKDTCKKLKHSEDTLPPQNRDFQTASGKGVVISSAALKKAKILLNECEGVDEIGIKPLCSKIPVPCPQSANSGFLAASGKPVALSAGALQKAKALFSDISFSAEIPSVSDTRNSDKTQDNAEKIHCGFMTAGGATVHVSQKHLLKAKNLFKEIDDGSISANTNQANTNVDPGFRHAEFENVHVGAAVNHDSVLHPNDVEINRSAFKNTPNSTNATSLVARPLSSKVCTPSKNIGFSAFNEFSSGGGFCTGSGKKVSVSDDAMTKAKCLLNESAVFENPNKKDILPPQSSGFQIASGKGVAISPAALKKAKVLLSEGEEVNDKTGVKPAHSKMSVSGPPPKGIHCGFTTAGGAKVHVLQQSLLKAKNLFKEFADGDCHDSDSHSTSPHDIPKSDLAKLKDVKRTSNFNLTNASDKDMSAKESVPQVLQSFPSLQETCPQIEDSSVHGFSFIKDKAPTDAFKCEEGKITSLVVDNWHDIPVEEMASVLDYEISQASFNQENKFKRTEESSFLMFQSLDLSSCTETEQKVLAQEALDCTKALLQDDGLADQNLSVTSENVPLQGNPKSSLRSEEEQNGRGKRPVEDVDMTGQPPLKRRLLEEFDRTVPGPRGSTLHPEKGCPKGVMYDRSVFKYSDSLHPNITKPHGNGKNYVETNLQKTISTQHITPGDIRTAHSKMPVFVPPFHKKAKTQTLKNTVLNDNTRAPSFIPPFKKQRTIVQESSSKAQEEDLHHLPFITISNNNTYAPPSKNTQSTKDLTENKSTGNIQIVALVDTTNDNMMTNQILPIGCGSEDSVAGTLGAKDTISRNPDMFHNLENVELARDMQDMRIRKKKRQTIRPLPGSLFLTKTSGVLRISLKAAVNGKLPTRYTQKQLYGYGVQQYVSEITSETAEDFRFNLQQFLKQEAFIDCGGVQLADGGWLITRNDNTAGKEEFYRALCDTPGVDPKLISEEWVYNHYRWIVWKQASTERSFPETMGSLCLTPEQVLLQLKYRYDVEVDHSRRPALRKIMERDDTPAKTLVLCVCGVVSGGRSPNRKSCSDTKTPQGSDAKVENQSAVVWLTDGWYAIKAQLDEPLTSMLHKGRLAVGRKLIIHGAQLVGSQDACSPLEAPESLMLKICANSSRPARWDTKLGFFRDPRPFLLPVSCLYSNGGPVGCVDIIILRSYPIQWMERKSDGSVVFRSIRAEEKEARRYNSHKEKAMETLFAKIQAEFEREEKDNLKPQHRRRTISHQDVASLQDGEELYEAVGDDPAYLEAHLSEKQLETLHTYRRSLMEKKQAELQDRYCRALEAESNEGICPKRDVTPVWRFCIADSVEQPVHVYQLNLWRPSSDLQSLLKEGCRYKVFNLTTSDGKKRSGIESVQLTGTKRTQFQDLQTSQEWLSARFHPRVSTSFVDLQNTEFQPLCGEVDLTGYVISIIDGQGSSPAFYLVDGKLNFVKVRCFSSLSQSGLEDLVKSRVLLALSNLQLRGQSMSPTPVVYAGDLTVFSTNPKEEHLRESLSQLRNLVQSHENFYQVAEEKLSRLIKSEGLSSISSPALQPRTPASIMDRRQNTKTSIISQQPFRNLGSFTPVSRNPPAASSSMEKDPRSLKRRRALDYLSRIPSPPGLSHLSSVASPCLNKTFNPPRRSGTPSTLKTVQTPASKPVTSPVEDEWVNDEELAMIDTQALCVDDVNR